MIAVVFKIDHQTTASIDLAADFLRSRPCGRPTEAVRACRRGFGLSEPEALTALADFRNAPS